MIEQSFLSRSAHLTNRSLKLRIKQRNTQNHALQSWLIRPAERIFHKEVHRFWSISAEIPDRQMPNFLLLLNVYDSFQKRCA